MMKKRQKSLFLLVFFSFIPISIPISLASHPLPWQMGFQPAASPVMERIADLHNFVFYIITAIVILVFALIGYVVFRFRESKSPVPSKRTHHTWLEIIWTITPTLILAWIAFSSFKLIYYMDKAQQAAMTIKVIGKQWYWTYEYPDEKVAFDSQIIQDHDLKPGQIRLLEVDHPLVVPVGVTIRLLMASEDVLHSWAVPALGIKQDNIPGRLRETWVHVNREGIYYGQCSELCGKGHGFMPVAVKAVSKKEYQEWVQQAKQKFSM